MHMSSLRDKIERLSRPNVKILSDHMRGIIIYCFLNFKSPSILQEHHRHHRRPHHPWDWHVMAREWAEQWRWQAERHLASPLAQRGLHLGPCHSNDTSACQGRALTLVSLVHLHLRAVAQIVLLLLALRKWGWQARMQESTKIKPNPAVNAWYCCIVSTKQHIFHTYSNRKRLL